ncbi:MAG: PfkB family carbohydrate kinase [Arachnia sp.]
MTGPVVIVSDALIDVVVAPGGAASASPGGAGLNCAIDLARLGTPRLLAYPVAPDEPGRRLRTQLQEQGVPVVALPGARETGVATATVVDGEPSFEFSAAVHSRRYTYPPAAIEAFRGARALAVNSFPMSDEGQVSDLLRVVAELGIPLAVDANARASLISGGAYRDGFLALAERATLVKASRQDLTVLFGDEAAGLRELRRRSQASIVVTAGSKGAAALGDFGQARVPIADLPGGIVNTTGSGDCVFAVLLSQLDTPGWPTTSSAWAQLLTEAMTLAGRVARREEPTLPPTQSTP